MRTRERYRPSDVVGEARQLAVFLAEALDHAHAADRFVDDARDLAGALQRVPLRREHHPPQAQRHEQQRGHDRQHHQREQRRQQEHHHERQHQEHDVAGGEREEAQQHLDQARGRSSRATRSGRWGAGRGARSRGVAPARRSWCAGRAARRTRTGRRRSAGCTRARSSPRRGRRAARAAARARAASVTITLSTTARSMSGMDDGDERGAERHRERDEDLPPVAGEERPEPAEPARRPRLHAPAVGARRAARRSERRSSSPARRARRARPTPRSGSSMRASTSSSRARIAPSASDEHPTTGRGDGERGDPAVVVEPRRAPPARAPPACRRSPTRWAWPARAGPRGGWPGRHRCRSWPGAGTAPG